MTHTLPSSPFRLHTTPFDAEGLVVGHLRGREALSEPFAFAVQALTPQPIASSDLPPPGQPFTLTIASNEDGMASPSLTAPGRTARAQ